MFQKLWRKSNCFFFFLRKSEPDRAQHDRPTARGIAQQYSSATFVSLRFNSRKDKSGARSKNVMISILYSFKIA
jgi:hypothetical protein